MSFFEHRNKMGTMGQVLCFMHDALNITDAHKFQVKMDEGKIFDHERMPFAVMLPSADGYPLFRFWGPKKQYWEDIQVEKRPEFVKLCQDELKNKKDPSTGQE